METSGTPSKMSHLKAGQDEVHSFLWGKDLEEPITGQQNEPTILGKKQGGVSHKLLNRRWFKGQFSGKVAGCLT